jgi:hypothetical protein
VQLAGLLCQYGYKDKGHPINHDKRVDVEAKINGKTAVFEYEIGKSNSIDHLVKKRELLLEIMV